MKFKQITSSKYISSSEYTLHQLKDGSFSIFKNGLVTKWGTNFQTVRAAENFLSHHDYINATSRSIPISSEDVDLIHSIYCSRSNSTFGNKWYIRNNFWIQGGYGYLPDKNLKFIQFTCSDGTCYNDADQLVEKLEAVSNIFSTSINIDPIRGIFAKKLSSNRSSGLSPSDLMRVKSSNVWAIGIEVNDKDRRQGNLYVQFKGKNGGPGDVYRYYDVPITLYRKFISAPSAGHFVWKYLRNNFQYSKLTGNRRGKLPNAIN